MAISRLNFHQVHNVGTEMVYFSKNKLFYVYVTQEINLLKANNDIVISYCVFLGYTGERSQSFCSSCKHSDCLDNGPSSDIPWQHSVKTQPRCFFTSVVLQVLLEDVFSANHGHEKGDMKKSTSGHEAHTAGICPICIIITNFDRVWAAWELLTQKSGLVVGQVIRKKHFW